MQSVNLVYRAVAPGPANAASRPESAAGLVEPILPRVLGQFVCCGGCCASSPHLALLRGVGLLPPPLVSDPSTLGMGVLSQGAGPSSPAANQILTSIWWAFSGLGVRAWSSVASRGLLCRKHHAGWS